MTERVPPTLPGRRKACLLLAAMPLLGMQAKAVAAPDFPSRPVTFVVPYAAGSAGDLWARMISPSLSKLWGQPVLVENKPGAGALIGMGHVRHAKPDGHTLLLGSLSTSMAGLTKANLDFDPQVELVPVYKYLTFKIIFATNPRTYAQAKTLRDLAAYSQTLSNGIFAGDTGPGTAFNMSMGFVLNALNVKYQSVSYNGISAISLALVRDDVQVIINAPTSLNSFLHEKTMYPIAVLSEKRYADMPDVQTVREAGYEGFLPEIWNGLFAPKGTPPEVIDKIVGDIQKVSAEPGMKERIESTFTGVIPPGGRVEFEQSLRRDTEQWQGFLKKIGFKPL
jgi:tripartite-type tricarboxylate transporter receptor subunit TctC